jgi:prepilin-type N-terminal cleavage/methylation domain-containing protein
VFFFNATKPSNPKFPQAKEDLFAFFTILQWHQILLSVHAMNNTPSLRRSAANASGFTLIELLVVISIIAILASLAFPAVGGAMDSAKKTTAKNAAVQIANAVVAYETEYGKLPTNSGTTVDTSFMGILSGTDTTNNPRGIVFLETSEWKKGKGGTNSSGYCDPWSSNTPYAIALDTDYNNKINVSTNGESSGTYEIMKKVGVWNQNTNSKYQIRSWE